MTGWQPIETAPKDGTPILVFIPKYKPLFGYHYDESQTVVSWDDLYLKWQLCETGSYAEDGDIFPDATHWQPLPLPPEDAETKE